MVPDAELQDAAFALARSMAEGPTLALRYMKDNLDEALLFDFATARDHEAERLVRDEGAECALLKADVSDPAAVAAMVAAAFYFAVGMGQANYLVTDGVHVTTQYLDKPRYDMHLQGLIFALSFLIAGALLLLLREHPPPTTAVMWISRRADPATGLPCAGIEYLNRLRELVRRHQSTGGKVAERRKTDETVPVAGGAAAVPALVAGELDISNGNHVSFILAASEGLDIRLVNEATHGVSLTNALIAPGDSEIDGPADMAGATIALNTFANITELIVRATLEDAGVGHDDYTFTEIPFPEQGAALERGDIDVALLPEPFITILLAEGNKVVGDPMTTPALEGLPLVGYAATGEFVAENPDVIESFQRAMAEATQIAIDDPSRVSDVLLANTQIPETLVEQITLPGWGTTPDLDSYQRTHDLMIEYGLLSDPLDNLDEFVVN